MAKTKEKAVASRIILRQALITRKDISDWKSAKQQCTRIDTPKFIRLQELYDRCMLDAHLSSQVSLRKSQTINADFNLLDNNKKINESATDILRNSPLTRNIISNILDSIFYGYSLCELLPDSNSSGGFSLQLLDRRHIDPIHGILYLNQYDQYGIDYRHLREYGSSILEFYSHTLGILDQAVPHILFKSFAQSCWSEYCEIYGMPPRYIKTNTQDTDLREQYEQMLKDVGSGANYVIDTDDEIGFADINPSDGSIYSNLIRLCSNEISLLINGAVLGQDTEFGSNSKEQTSSALNQEIVKSDAVLVESAMTNIVLPALASYGIIPQGLVFRFMEQEDNSELFDQTMRAAAYFDIDPKWVKEKFGIEVTVAKNLGGNLHEKHMQDLNDFFV